MPQTAQFLERARAAMSNGDLMTAEPLICRALENDAKNAEALLLLGRCRYLHIINKMSVALGRLKVQGFDLKTAVDIGAYHGWWTRCLKRVYPEARVLMIEPQESCRPFLEETAQAYSPTVDFRLALLGREPRSGVPFHVMETGSSIYPENTNANRQLTALDMTTLPIVAAAAGCAAFDLIKLDVQGAELDVLAGAVDLMDKAEAVLLEASMTPYNAGAPLFADVVAFMAEHGFVVYDIADTHRQGETFVLYQCDVLFARKGGKLHVW